MTGIGYALRCELDLLLRMLPFWRGDEGRAMRIAQDNPEDGSALFDWLQAHFKVQAALEKVEFINTLLRNNPDE